MPVEVNAEEDFANFVDRLESVTLQYRGSGGKVAISSALRHSTSTLEAEPSAGAAIQSDATWHLQLPEGEVSPSMGDVLIDESGNRWTILDLEELSYLGRWRCSTRELSVAFGCFDRVDIQRAIWDDLGSGPEIVDWSYAFTALPVKIQPLETTVDDSVSPEITASSFYIILSEQISLDPDDRFVAEDGSIYKLVSLQQEDRLDVLPIAQVLKEASTE